MSKHTRSVQVPIIAAILLMIPAGLAFAGAHTWRVNELFSDSTGTIQFVELKECCGGNFETGAPGHNVTSNSKSFLIPGGALPPVTSFKTLLIATPGFAALPGAPTPDYIIPAGSVPFFSTTGDSVSYVPYDTLTFGAGQLPTDGIHSLNTGAVVNCNSPTNFAGQTGTVRVGCSIPGDVDHNGVVNGDDVAGFIRATLGAPSLTDASACAEFCTGSVDGNIAAFVSALLS